MHIVCTTWCVLPILIPSSKTFGGKTAVCFCQTTCNTFITNRGRQRITFFPTWCMQKMQISLLMPVGMNGGGMSLWLKLHPLRHNNTPSSVRCFTFEIPPSLFRPLSTSSVIAAAAMLLLLLLLLNRSLGQRGREEVSEREERRRGGFWYNVTLQSLHPMQGANPLRHIVRACVLSP